MQSIKCCREKISDFKFYASHLSPRLAVECQSPRVSLKRNRVRDHPRRSSLALLCISLAFCVCMCHFVTEGCQCIGSGVFSGLHQSTQLLGERLLLPASDGSGEKFTFYDSFENTGKLQNRFLLFTFILLKLIKIYKKSQPVFIKMVDLLVWKKKLVSLVRCSENCVYVAHGEKEHDVMSERSFCVSATLDESTPWVNEARRCK